MISKHISIEEATFSQKAIDNKISNLPNDEQLENMQYVAENLFEKVREWYGKPIRINSFLRCAQVNKLVGGSATSQHCKGQAIDISTGSKVENKKLFEYIKSSALDFDQLIYEYGDLTGPQWVHISLKKTGNRKQILHIK
jgi:zinc D-Ala-D-Ala carboxypeptidase